MSDGPDNDLSILESKTEGESCKRSIDTSNQQNHDCHKCSEQSSDSGHSPPHPSVESPEMPEGSRVVIDLAEHASDVDITFIECSNGAYSCESTSELFEDGGLGI